MTQYLDPLDTPTLRQLNIPEPWTFGVADRVRFYELDALNHVNNVTYLRWFETTRIRWLSDYKISFYSENDPTLVIRALSSEYLAPMFLNDDYVVTARCISFRKTSFKKEYAVWSGGKMTVHGTAVIVMTEADGTTKRALPVDMRETVVARDGAVDEGAGTRDPA
ncbi:MAG: thioesterase family protein [Pseudomonadota bacterium]